MRVNMEVQVGIAIRRKRRGYFMKKGSDYNIFREVRFSYKTHPISHQCRKNRERD